MKKILVSIFLILILAFSALVASFGLEPFFKVIEFARSAFDVDPTPQVGSNLQVCTVALAQGNGCSTPLQPTLSWNVTSGTQVSYAVQIDNNGWLPKSPSSSFPSPEIETGQIDSSSSSYAVPLGSLAYGTTYYWQVAVKDALGSWSGWTEADASFTTPTHHWPNVNFSWAPVNPSLGEVVQFADQSICYDVALHAISCSGWFWTIPNATYEDGTNANSQNPRVKFTTEGPKNIVLQTTDPAGNSCTVTKTITNINKPLPDWKEVAPQ